MAELSSMIEGLAVGQSHAVVVPQKLALGGKVKGSKQPGLFRVYMPLRDGGRLELETTAGEIEVLDPRGRPAKDAEGNDVPKGKQVHFEVPQGTFGWYGVVVRGSASYEVTAGLVIEGHAKDRDGSMLAPWNFWYWPFKDVLDGNNPAEKWDQRFGTKAFEWEKKSYWRSEIDSRSQRRTGMDGHCITQEFVDEYNEYLGREVVKFADTGWWGHCDAAAVASAVFRQPEDSGNLKQADLEWAATEVAMRGYQLDIRFFLGGLGNNSRSHPSHLEAPKDEPGQSIDKDIAPFHEALIKLVKHEAQPALVDLRSDFKEDSERHGHVWNQTVYKFRMELTQAEEDEPGKDPDALARKLAVKCMVHANADTRSAHGNPEDPAGSGWDRELHYKLRADGSGKVPADDPYNNVTKCTWERTGHDYYMPRYIFRIKGIGETGGNGNPHVKLADLRSANVRKRALYGG